MRGRDEDGNSLRSMWLRGRRSSNSGHPRGVMLLRPSPTPPLDVLLETHQAKKRSQGVPLGFSYPAPSSCRGSGNGLWAAATSSNKSKSTGSDRPVVLVDFFGGVGAASLGLAQGLRDAGNAPVLHVILEGCPLAVACARVVNPNAVVHEARVGLEGSPLATGRRGARWLDDEVSGSTQR